MTDPTSEDIFVISEIKWDFSLGDKVEPIVDLNLITLGKYFRDYIYCLSCQRVYEGNVSSCSQCEGSLVDYPYAYDSLARD
jgi:hypothetical protein